MPDFDLSRLPKGERGRRALLEYVMSSDDRVERYFLEVKSDVDLTTKAGRAKVAKFVLGAANRDPDRAARRFDGHALMVLGVSGDGEAEGVGAFEAMDLERDVRKFLGVNGPSWDFERIPITRDRDVIVVIADPPTGAMWACNADGSEELEDGTFYVRGDGDTRKATGAEIHQMLQRTKSVRRTVDVDVEFVGEIASYRLDETPILEAIDREADAMLPKPRPRPKPGQSMTAAIILGDSRHVTAMERRSRDQFIKQVEAWRAAVKADPLAGVRDRAARALNGVQVRVVNRSKTFLRDVRVEIEFSETVTAVAWQRGTSAGFDPFPGRPMAWGKDTVLTSHIADIPPLTQFSRSRDGRLIIDQEHPARLVLILDDLRPMATRDSNDDDVVLLILQASPTAEAATGRWNLTAGEVNEVFEDEFSAPVHHTDVDSAVLFADPDDR